MAAGVSLKDFAGHKKILVEILALGLAGRCPTVMKKIGGYFGDCESACHARSQLAVSAVVF
jgi:hypothetical protein